MSSKARALHYVFRVGNRQASYDFYVKNLGMKVLRHEEFEEGCAATCNGPYPSKWSKTMVGYGNEDDHFVLELTYNYGISSYKLGNDYNSILVESDIAWSLVKDRCMEINDEVFKINDPDGHPFVIKKSPTGKNDDITKVTLNVKNLAQSKEFWTSLAKMSEESSDSDKCVLSYAKNQCKLELHQLKNEEELERAEAYGRIAFSAPQDELKDIEERMKKANPHYIQNNLSCLDTPGKASVWVVILRDPNDHEICYVGDEAYRQLASVDANAEKLFLEAIKKE